MKLITRFFKIGLIILWAFLGLNSNNLVISKIVVIKAIYTKH